jgi:hypothetical protein
MHICFPYQTQNGFASSVVEYIERIRPRLTIVNSTVVPGTVRHIAEVSSAPIAYSPVRGKHATMPDQLLHYTKFVASPDSNAAQEAVRHFRSYGMDTKIMQSVEALELAKLAETTYFGLLIAYAQELNRFALKVGGNYEEAVDFFREIDFLPRTKYFPGFIGGHCVIPNIKLLRQIVASPLLDGILDSNDRRAGELRAAADNSSLRGSTDNCSYDQRAGDPTPRSKAAS